MEPKQPPDSQQAYLERLERSFDMLAQHQAQLGSPETAMRKLIGLREVIERLRLQQHEAAAADASAQPQPTATPKAKPAPAPAAVRKPPPADPARTEGPALTWREFDAIFSFYEDAVDAIQVARHSVRHGQPLRAEPDYPKDRAVVLEMIRRVFLEARRQ